MDHPEFGQHAFDKRFWVCGILVSIAAMLLLGMLLAWLNPGRRTL
jgi:hypothetical protein